MVTPHARRAGACLLALTLLLAGCQSRSPLPDSTPAETTAVTQPNTVTSIEPHMMADGTTASIICRGGVFALQTQKETPGEVYCTSITYGSQRLEFAEPLYLCGGNFRNEVFVTADGALALLLTGDSGSDGYFLTKDAVHEFHTADVADGAVFLSPGEDGGLRYQKVMSPCLDLLQSSACPSGVSPEDTYSEEGSAAIGKDGLTFAVDRTTTVQERLDQFST